jgi:hypothetical protein
MSHAFTKQDKTPRVAGNVQACWLKGVLNLRLLQRDKITKKAPTFQMHLPAHLQQAIVTSCTSLFLTSRPRMVDRELAVTC